MFKNDLTGLSKGGIKVVRFLENNNKHQSVWECCCLFCNKTFPKTYGSIINKSCKFGCKQCAVENRRSKHKSGDYLNGFLVMEVLNTQTRCGVKASFFRVKCLSCGVVVEKFLNDLQRNKSCGCIQSRAGKESPCFQGFGDVPKTMLSSIKKNAKIRNISFDETIDCRFLWDLFLKQNKQCGISGVELVFGNNKNETTASVDRIDSSKGYVEGNVQWVHKDVNVMKFDLKQEYFLELCSKIVEFQKGKNNE